MVSEQKQKLKYYLTIKLYNFFIKMSMFRGIFMVLEYIVKDNKNKIAILISSIIGSFTYNIIIICVKKTKFKKR